MKESCTCIVPFYNEERGIESVLRKLVTIDHFDQMILVNDGSTDSSQALVEAFIENNRNNNSNNNNKNLMLISYAENKGKSNAVYEGLKASQTDYVFLFDADIRNIKTEEIEVLIEDIYAHPEIDMGILRRVRAKRYIKVLYRELILSGQRMLKASDLKHIFQDKFDRYQLEVAINTYMHKRKKTIVRSPYSGDNTFKSEKRGFIGGRKRNMLMYKDILGYQGTANFFKHTFLFHPHELKKYKKQKELK